MTRIIKNFILIMLFVVINDAIAFHLDSFGENIMSYNRLKIFRDQKIIASSSSISFYMYDVSPKLGNGIYNLYYLKKGNGLELTFKSFIKNKSFFSRKKMAFRVLMLFSKKLVKTLEVNEKKNDLIILSFDPIKKS